MSSSTIPLGGAAFTAWTPMRPAAPVRFSRITGLLIADSEMLRHDAAEHVAYSAGGEGEDDPDRLFADLGLALASMQRRTRQWTRGRSTTDGDA